MIDLNDYNKCGPLRCMQLLPATFASANIIPALYMSHIHVYVIEATSFIKRTMTSLHIAVEFYTHCSNKRHDCSAMDGYKCV